MKERIICIRLRDGLLEILEKVGETSYDALHMGVLNDSCFKRIKELLGGLEREFKIWGD